MADTRAILPEPRGVLTAFDELLKRPMASLERARQGAPVVRLALRLFAGSLACYVLYGATAGLFEGGAQVLVSAVKAPIIVGWSVLLCVPSLYVFGSLAGADLTGRRFLVTLSGFTGMIAALMLGLLPIEWLFSASSTSVTFVVWLHIVLWCLALAFAGRFLQSALHEMAGGALFLWLVLFCLVSFQVTTFLRPTLWRNPNAPVLRHEKQFFLDHFNEVVKGHGG